MTFQEMKQILRQISYKPKTQIELIETMFHGDTMLSISFPVINAIDRSTRTTFSQNKPVPKDKRKNADVFISWVYEMVILAETHEVNEYFRFRDRHWVQPHPDNSPGMIEEEQRRYEHHKQLRESGYASLADRPIEPMQVYERYRAPFSERYEFKQYPQDPVPNLSQESLGKMLEEMKPVFHQKFQGNFRDERMYWYNPKELKKPTAEGVRKKKKRAKSDHKKGFSNKPWDALR